jgi:hypothetical protein
MVLAAGLAVFGLLCWYVGLMIMGGGGQEFFVAGYAFLILAAVRFVWAVASRGGRAGGAADPESQSAVARGRITGVRHLVDAIHRDVRKRPLAALGDGHWVDPRGYPRGVGRVDWAVPIRGPVPVLATPTLHRTSVLMSLWEDLASPRRPNRPQHSRRAGG